MHEHKHNQCRRKVKHRKNVMKLIIFCITVGISLMFIYYQNLRKEIDARQKWLETVLTGEKKWILENQGPEGEFYMNGSKAGELLADIWTGIPGFCWKQMEKWESTGKRVGNLFIKKRLIPKTGILVCIFFLWENIRYIQAKQDGYAWNVRNCMDYMKEK